VSAGSIATIVGNFGLNPPAQSATITLPTALSGLSIQFGSAGEISAPLFNASAGQAKLQVPWELSAQGSAPIRVVLNGNLGPIQNQELVPFAPLILTTNGQASGVASSRTLPLI